MTMVTLLFSESALLLVTGLIVRLWTLTLLSNNGRTDFWTFVHLLSLDVRAVFIRLLNLFSPAI